ncbi:CRISPR-associated helicase Cas3' [Candidatus Bathyarchaeota archaeon]|nr:CRISPR-associated helicase Cas3' [Candidatus Bathyarchaeota archaeon]
MNIKEIFKAFSQEPYKHQLEASEILLKGKPVVIRAPCGSGKTEACVFPFLLGRGEYLPRRLIYSLPTRSLVEDIASRLEDRLKKLNFNVSLSRQHGADSKDPFFRENIIITTIDQTVGAYYSTPLSLPTYLGNIPSGAAVSSLLCFDEVHTYDHELGLKTMIILVERALKLELPFVVMSATLPDSFLEWFKENGVSILRADDENIPTRKERNVILKWHDHRLTVEDIVEAFQNYKKVIVVCNTVVKAQEIYSDLNDDKVHLLHSRFTAEDRKKNEKNVIDAFKNNDSAYLITTQVCEVGLDISCDLMLTELAPPDALIQRIGRCARKGGKGKVYVYDVEYAAPYSDGSIEQSRKYVSNELNGKTVDWKQELEFVNQLLGPEFQEIMKDEGGRRKILSNLGDAAFKGDKRKIEENVRDILSVNITIHENPCSLEKVLWLMPWINVDVRVLKKAMKDFNLNIFRVDYIYDERKGSSYDCHEINDPYHLYPFENYILSPINVRYDSNRGLIFGEEGENLEPQIRKEKDTRGDVKYFKETWFDHVRKSLSAFDKIKKEELPLNTFSNLLKYDSKSSEGILALSVALHDLGKLNKMWQKSVGIENNSEVPLAHIEDIYIGHRPGHAVVSGYASLPLFKKLIGKEFAYNAIALAISHHHHARSENLERYEIGWKELVRRILDDVASKYGLDINSEDIIWSQRPSILPYRFPSVENTKSYTIYAIASRLIRLSDRESFGMDKKL